jgi:Holliday junction DNA helicase RuvA
MIAFLTGKLRMAGLNYVVVDAGGVGYRVSVPLSLMSQMPAVGQNVELFIHTQVREDAIQLFGFPALEDQELFEMLITVSGVGAKVALGMMSVLPADAVAAAIADGDAAALQRVPGVGAKTAQRIVLELKDKMSETMWERRASGSTTSTGHGHDTVRDAIEALIALGYPKAQAKSAAEKALDNVSTRNDVGAIVRSALQLLAKR